MNEQIGYVFICIGVAFNLFGCIGLIRLPDVYNRLQAAAKCVTLGVSGTLFGVFLINGFSGTGIKALLAIGFLLLTAPSGAQALSRAAYLSGIKAWKKSGLGDSQEEKELRETT
ncbi:MAG: monovalent cation/H(+) antiporter subunit G [Candidatus Margulisiibacteriota bacterium]